MRCPSWSAEPDGGTLVTIDHGTESRNGIVALAQAIGLLLLSTPSEVLWPGIVMKSREFHVQNFPKLGDVHPKHRSTSIRRFEKEIDRFRTSGFLFQFMNPRVLLSTPTLKSLYCWASRLR